MAFLYRQQKNMKRIFGNGDKHLLYEPSNICFI